MHKIHRLALPGVTKKEAEPFSFFSKQPRGRSDQKCHGKMHASQVEPGRRNENCWIETRVKLEQNPGFFSSSKSPMNANRLQEISKLSFSSGKKRVEKRHQDLDSRAHTHRRRQGSFLTDTPTARKSHGKRHLTREEYRVEGDVG